MICPPCSLGAALLVHRAEHWAPTMEDYHSVEVIAKILHGDCRGGTHCDCQHSLKVKEKIDWKAVKGDE